MFYMFVVFFSVHFCIFGFVGSRRDMGWWGGWIRLHTHMGIYLFLMWTCASYSTTCKCVYVQHYLSISTNRYVRHSYHVEVLCLLSKAEWTNGGGRGGHKKWLLPLLLYHDYYYFLVVCLSLYACVLCVFLMLLPVLWGSGRASFFSRLTDEKGVSGQRGAETKILLQFCVVCGVWFGFPAMKIGMCTLYNLAVVVEEEGFRCIYLLSCSFCVLKGGGGGAVWAPTTACCASVDCSVFSTIPLFLVSYFITCVLLWWGWGG